MAVEGEIIEHEAWPQRAAMLLGLGAGIGLAAHFLTKGTTPWAWTDNPLRLALAAGLGVGGIVLGFSLERLRWQWSVAFAAIAGLVFALITFFNGAPGGWGAGDGWQFVAGLVAVAVAVPLFQAARDEGRRRFETRAVHVHAWTNLILWAVACGFVIATFLLALLLSELFGLIGMNFLRDLLREGWFTAMLLGGAFGGAVGLLRDRDRVLGLVQKVGTGILSVLALPLALGLVLFVAALPFTGLEPLWEQTSATTPVLIACAIGAVFLANAAIGNSADEEARAPAVRWAAAALAAVVLPLGLVAALSTGKRIAQHGFTPDRLWAAVVVAVIVAVGLLYLWALIHGRGGWPALLRRANLRLAAGICLLALFLALPIVDFGAVSARDQLARLEAGEVPPEQFDWAAMRFDFGPAGQRALERLARSGGPQLRARAAEWLKAEDRWAMTESTDRDRMRITPEEMQLSAVPQRATIPEPLRLAVAASSPCAEPCRLIFDTPERALVVGPACPDCEPFVHLYHRQPDGRWLAAPPAPQSPKPPPPGPPSSTARTGAEGARGALEVRTVQKRQAYLDGEPIGPVFDP